jgi:hypothetical protein
MARLAKALRRLLDDPRRWEDRANELRVIAVEINDAEARITLLELAELYERMAAHARRRRRL